MGTFAGIRVISLLYAALLCFTYVGIRMDEMKKWSFRVIPMFIPILVLFWEYRSLADLKGASGPYLASFFAAFIAGGVFVFLTFLDIYERTKK